MRSRTCAVHPNRPVLMKAYPTTGSPSTTRSVTTATIVEVMSPKENDAFRICRLSGTVFARTSRILTSVSYINQSPSPVASSGHTATAIKTINSIIQYGVDAANTCSVLTWSSFAAVFTV